MLVKDAIKELLECPWNAKIIVTAYEDGPQDEEGEPPSNDHAAVNFGPKLGDDKIVYLYTYPERWR